MRSLRPLLAAIPFIALAGCDYVDDPIQPGGAGGGGSEVVTKKVLLEDLTGHRCNNCPAAAAVAQQLHGIYGEELIVVGVHATSAFAAPVDPPNPNGSYATDFRTIAGEVYVGAFGVQSLPTGLVSRKAYNGSRSISDDAWGSAVADLIGQPADLDMWFSQFTHNPATNTINAEVKVAVLNTVQGDHNLTIYLTEDSVIDWQYDSQATPPDVPNYVHRHVLRNNLNGTWGAPLISGSATAGDTLTLTYSGFAIDPAWNPDHLALVGYAHQTANDEVVQAAERKLRP